ncbi:10649_t:CDS:10 [Paraglomus occultum]|uniref:10649_t:CDS:1 n=1 Tax=Paraglomus occultum TaxID=144539 RepID=A0A9N9C520_9GLOM|nr:10649_t:CDS:10 [Paraglomus occultum]
MEPRLVVNDILDKLEANIPINTNVREESHSVDDPYFTINALGNLKEKTHLENLLRFIKSERYRNNVDLATCAKFVTRILSEHLREAINPENFAPVLKLFNTYKDENNNVVFREYFCLLIQQLLHQGYTPMSTWFLSLKFIYEEARSLIFVGSNGEGIDKLMKDTAMFVKTQCHKIRETVAYENLFLCRLVESVLVESEKNTNVEIDRMLTLCEGLLELAISQPDVHEVVINELGVIINHSDFFVVQSTIINLSLYWNEFAFRIDPILQEIRLDEDTGEKLLVGVKLPHKLRQMMYNSMIDTYINYVTTFEKDIRWCIDNNEDIIFSVELPDPNVFNELPDVKALTSNFAHIAKNDILDFIGYLGHYASNASFRFSARILLTLHTFYELINSNITFLQDVDFVNTIADFYLCIWLYLLAKPLDSTAAKQKVKFSTVMAIFLHFFDVSQTWLWKRKLSYVFFLRVLVNICKRLDEEYLKLILAIFDKLSIDIPLSVIAMNPGDLMMIADSVDWLDILQQRINNITNTS